MTPLGIIHALLGTLLIGVVAKATAVLMLAGCVTLLRRRASASERHLVWLVALATCLLLAALAPVVPTVAVRLPLAAPAAPAQPRRLEARRLVAVLRTAVLRPAAEPFTITAPRQMVVRPRLAVAFSWLTAHRTALLLVVWLVGCVAVLLRCAFGHVMVAALVRRSVSVDSAQWASSLRAATADAGVQRRVGLLCCEQIAAPITSGFTHPVVMLPPDADTWPSERRRVVLLHELAHVARYDYVAQIVGVLASAAFWFHPLVWLALDRLRAEAENAADDRVLAAGTPNLTYAAHLLDLARGEAMAHPPLAAAVGLLRSSHLEGRFCAMLDDARSHAAVSRRGRIVATAFACAAVGPLAGARTVAARAPASADPAVTGVATRGRAPGGAGAPVYDAAAMRTTATQRLSGRHSSAQLPSRASGGDVLAAVSVTRDSAPLEVAGPTIGERVDAGVAGTVVIVAEMPSLRMMSTGGGSARHADRVAVSPEAEAVAHLPAYGSTRSGETSRGAALGGTPTVSGCWQSAADSTALHPLINHYGRLLLNPEATHSFGPTAVLASARIDIARADEWGDPQRGTQLGSFNPAAAQATHPPQCASGGRLPE